MNQVDLLANELKKLFNGASWIDVNIIETLSPLSAEQAAAKPFESVNSIWEIVNHLVSWRKGVLKRVQGVHFPSPENNFFEPVADTSSQAWKETLQQLNNSQQAWSKALEGMNATHLGLKWVPGNQTNYELISGILQHDAYHLGQIVLLKKFV
ncbi:MAG: DinB family protein [Chitinophagales bacterium]